MPRDTGHVTQKIHKIGKYQKYLPSQYPACKPITKRIFELIRYFLKVGSTEENVALHTVNKEKFILQIFL